ncbi:MAG: transketolase [Bacteroidales bacterium]|nr:transketolase [Bacteroidales bacterium]
MADIQKLTDIASQVRRDVIRMVTAAGSGHPGGSIGIADVMTVLFFDEMHHESATWTRGAKGQDGFILSAGHLAPVLYSVLARTGYFPLSELGTLRKIGSRLQGHPSVSDGLPGINIPSGSLGQGLAAAAGIALGKKMDGEENRVYVLCGDGECEEGEIWETAMWAPHNKLDNLIAFIDLNGQQIDGETKTITGIEDLGEKWSAFGWEVIEADGHDFESILKAFGMAHARNGKPKMILFRTEMGHGVDFMAGTCEWHGKAPKPDQAEIALSQLKETLGDYE